MLKHPGNRGVIFRRVFPSLNRTIIPRATALLKPWAKYNKVEHTFTFTNGSVLELASLQYKDSVTDYQGAEYGVICFEEVTEFLESQLDFMKSRLRAPVEGVRPHLVATTNPGGVGHAWVKRRYVRPKPDDYAGDVPPAPFEVWRPPPSDADPEPLTRCFVPATLKDNPKLCKRDPAYINKIRGMRNRGLRLALKKGDWDAIEKIEGAQWSTTQIDYFRVKSCPPRSEFVRTAVGWTHPAARRRPTTSRGSSRWARLQRPWVRLGGPVMQEIDSRLGATSSPAGPRRRRGSHRRRSEFGGDMAVSPLEDAAKELGWEGKVKLKNVSKSKRVRAEPVAVKYGDPDQPETWDELGKMHHVGDFEALEAEMVTWRPEDGVSPNRMDAFVFAADEVMVTPEVDYDIPDHGTDTITGDLMDMKL